MVRPTARRCPRLKEMAQCEIRHVIHGFPDCIRQNEEIKIDDLASRSEGKQMVLWCKSCGAFMGVREPFEDWTTDRNALCQHCAPEHFDLGHIKAESKNDDEENTSDNPLPK